MKLFGKLAALRRSDANKKALKTDNELYLYGTEKLQKVLFVTVLGVSTDHLEEIVDTIAEKFKRYERIVYITDTPDFSIFRQRQATFEYIPSLASQTLHAKVMDWQSYLKARWELLLVKWQPNQIIAYGNNFDRFLLSASRRGPADGL